MAWKYRIIEMNTKPDPSYYLKYVWYPSNDGPPHFWSNEPAPIMWFKGETHESIRMKINEAFRLPIINENDLVNDEVFKRKDR